ncbi:MAG: hypothetical protein Q9220_006504 [cf. Caloplaca sp. 1 TL-2023]
MEPLLPPHFSTTKPLPALLALGAEAHVYRTHFLTPSHPCILKYRPRKRYRHPALDLRLTRHRILSEARTLVKCKREGIDVPGILALDADAGWMMEEWVEGGTVKDRLHRWRDWMKKYGKTGDRAGWEQVVELMRRIGEALGRLHEVGVVHGDLTTSNLMLRKEEEETVITNGEAGSQDMGQKEAEVTLDGELVLIDFGLAGQSVQDEDKAVDLYVLERAFGSTHPDVEDGFVEVLKAYGQSYKGAKVVLKRLEEVRMRGRKKSMIG